jgi:hypothetical protein
MEPLFLDGSAGRLFAPYQAAAAHPRGSVIYVPPFAEEMNRSRRMAALQARAFAAMGFGVLSSILRSPAVPGATGRRIGPAGGSNAAPTRRPKVPTR